MYCIIQTHIFRVTISWYSPLHHVFCGVAPEPVICNVLTSAASIVFLIDNICISLILTHKEIKAFKNP